jgi:hypothetical protein
MATYRLYTFDGEGHVAGPPRIIESSTDDDAVEAARWYAAGNAVELWIGDRLVRRLEPSP